MRRVHVEEAAAVRAELLDRDLARGRPERHRLLGDDLRPASPGCPPRRARGSPALSVDGHLDRHRIEQLDRAVRREALHDALRHQHDCEHERQRQQDVQRAAREIDPEVADLATCRRAKPRINATSTAMPEAADRKFCTASPSICVR